MKNLNKDLLSYITTGIPA